MSEFKRIEELSRSSLVEDRVKAQQWARDPHVEMRKRARELGEQFRRAGGVQRGIASKILDLDLVAEADVKEPSDDPFMLSWLSWYKFGKTWRQVLHERSAGSWKASQQMVAIIRDFERWKFGKLDPNQMHFKIDRIHFNLMAFGLDFGLDQLTSDELAECFDALCSCGKRHEPENLRKLRGRIFKSLAKLDAKTAALKTKND